MVDCDNSLTIEEIFANPVEDDINDSYTFPITSFKELIDLYNGNVDFNELQEIKKILFNNTTKMKNHLVTEKN